MKIRRIIIRSVVISLVAVVLLFSTALIIAYSNQKRLTQTAIEELNKSFVGELEVGDSYITLFKNFPYLSIDLHNVKFFGDKTKSNKPLYEAEDLYLGFRFLDLLKGEFNVRILVIKNGHLDVIQHTNGDINILLAKGIRNDTTDTSDSDFHLELRKMIIRNFHVTYLKEETGQHTEAEIDKVKASIRLRPNHMFIDLETSLLLTIMNKQDTSFFHDKHIELNTTLDYDEQEELLLLTDTHVKLEDGLFNVTGSIDFKDDLNLNLELKGEKPDFDLLIAFAPPEIADNLKRYKNEGKIYFNGIVQGKAANGNNPFVEVSFGCSEAYFLNKENNRKVDELGFNAYFTNGESRSIETTEFRLMDFKARPEQGTFTGNFVVRNFKDPYIAMQVFSDLDLEFLGDFLGVEGLQRLKGKIILKMDFNELVDINMPENNLAKLKEGINSDLIVRNLSFRLPNYPHPIRDMNVHAQMRGGKVILDSLAFRVGNSDIYLDGSLSDLPAIFHHQHKPIEVTLNARSKKFVLQELLSYDTALANRTKEEITDFAIKLAFETTTDNLFNADPLPNGEFFIKDFYAKLKNYPHTFHDFDADIIVTDTTFTVKNFTGTIDKSDFHLHGMLSNYPIWLGEVKKGDTQFNLDLTSNHLALHDLLTYNGESYLPEDYKNEEINELKLHSEINLHYDTTLKAFDLVVRNMEGLMKVHPLKFENFNGRVHYEDEHLTVEDFSGKMGKSEFTVGLTFYSGQDKSLKKRDNKFSLRAKFLDIDQLMNYDPKEDSAHEEAFNIFQLPFTDMTMEVSVDKLNYHRLWLRDFNARLRMQENHYLYIDTLGMAATGGTIGMKGYLNGSNPDNIYFKSDIALQNVNIEKVMIKLDQHGQDYEINKNLKGYVSGRISSLIHVHPDLTPILQDGEAQLDIVIWNGSLVDFGPMQAMSGYFKDKNLRIVRFDTLRNTLSLKNGVLTIPSMNINSSLGFIEISGKQALDQKMDYHVRVPMQLVTQVGFQTLFGGKRKEEVDPEQEDSIQYRDKDKRVRFLNIKISGTPESYNIALARKSPSL